MKIIDENESVEKAHAILKIWGDALQTITSPKPSPPPTLNAENRGGSTDVTDSNKGLTNGDCSNGILSFLALSPVFSFIPVSKPGYGP